MQNKSLLGIRPKAFLGLQNIKAIADYVKANYLSRKGRTLPPEHLERIIAVLALRKTQNHNSTPIAVAIDQSIASSLSGVPGLLNSIQQHIPNSGIGVLKQHNYIVTLIPEDLKIVEGWVNNGTFFKDLQALKFHCVSYNIGLDPVKLGTGVVPTLFQVIDTNEEGSPSIPLDLRPTEIIDVVSHSTLDKLDSDLSEKVDKQLADCEVLDNGDIVITEAKDFQFLADNGIAVRSYSQIINNQEIDFDESAFHSTTPTSQVKGLSMALGVLLPFVIFEKDTEVTNQFDILFGTTNVFKFDDFIEYSMFINQALTVASDNFFKDSEVPVESGITKFTVAEKLALADPSLPHGKRTPQPDLQFSDPDKVTPEDTTSVTQSPKPRQGAGTSSTTPNPKLNPPDKSRGRGQTRRSSFNNLTSDDIRFIKRLNRFFGLYSE